MTSFKAKGQRRATLRAAWWKSQMRLLRHCFACGFTLARTYVRAERRWRRSCSQCGQITYVNPKVVAGLIPVLPDGRVVLLQRDIDPAAGKWSYPAGYQEIGESTEQAAVREAYEEIVADVKITGFVGVYSYADAGVVTVVYAGLVKNGSLPRAGHESRAVRFLKPQRIPWKDLAFRSTADALTDWIKISRKQRRRAS